MDSAWRDEQIRYLIDEFAKDLQASAYQMSALAMAAFFRGSMTETATLTDAMLRLEVGAPT